MPTRTLRGLAATGVMFASVSVGITVLVALLGRLTWGLSPAATSPPGGVAASQPNRHPVEAEGTHRVAEWPASLGRAFQEAPMLAARSAGGGAGHLPSVADRLPENPLVIVPPESRGPYGGTWRRFGIGPADVGIFESRFAYEGLVRWDAMGRTILPNLATHWTIEDDGRTFTFYLRRGVRWSDGAPFTTADVRFWYEDVLQNKDLTPVIPVEFCHGGALMRLETPDDFTLRLRFNACHGLFMQYLASGGSIALVNAPAHYLKRYHPRYTPMERLVAEAKTKGWDLWHQLWADRRDWRNPDVPRLWAWVLTVPPPAEPVRFERNPYYFKVDPDGRQLPYIDAITFEDCSLDTINMKAINGEIGMQDRHIAFANYPLFMENQERGRYEVRHWIDGSGTSAAIIPNLDHRDPVLRKLLEDRRFRIALSLAINRRDINEWHYLGIGFPRQVAPPPTSPFYSASYEQAYIEYDPDRANRMLDEIGLTHRDGDGTRLRSDGRPLTVYLDTTESYWWPAEAIQRVADCWTAVGVKTIVRVSARPLWQERVWAMRHDFSVWSGADEMQPLLDPRYFFPVSDAAEGGLDYAKWFVTSGARGQVPPPELQECMRIYRRIQLTIDEAEQVRLFRQILDLNEKNLWVIGLVGRIPPLTLVKKGFLNVPKAAVVGWVFRTPGNTAPECYAIRP